MSGSEVARMKEQIEVLCQAMQQGLTGYAEVAKHRIVSLQYNQIETCTRQLEALVGHDEATTITCEIYNRVIERNNG